MAADKKDDPFGSLDLDTTVPVPAPPPKAGRPPGLPKPKPPQAAPPPPAAPVAPEPPPPPAAKPEVVPSVGKMAKVAAKMAAEVCQLYPLEDPAQALLREDLLPGQYLYLLIEKQLYEDAVRFLAHGLAKPEAVGWACQCLRGLAGGNPPPEAAAALHAAERWAADPNEANRLAALPPAEALEFSTPAACAALAAFRSNGYYSPSLGTPLLPPNEYLTAQAVTEALVGAAEEGGSAAEKYRKILSLGIGVGNGITRGK